MKLEQRADHFKRDLHTYACSFQANKQKANLFSMYLSVFARLIIIY